MDRYYIVEVKVREEFFYLLWQDDLFVLSDQDLLESIMRSGMELFQKALKNRM